MSSEDLISSDGVFNKQQQQMISAIADAMIKKDELLGLPSASDPLVMETIMNKAAHFSGRLIEGINALSEEIDKRTTTPEALLDVLDKNPKFRSFSRMLTIVVMQSYYQDPRVLTAHGQSARPPFPLGHDVESGDWSLLDQVKQRTPFYRLT
ncbi:MAG: hypothetical protein H8E49_12510 [Gammaproteobacteria bacterium]|nr:hypothetical protein [Gammaproteobacteria bacterium]